MVAWGLLYPAPRTHSPSCGVEAQLETSNPLSPTPWLHAMPSQKPTLTTTVGPKYMQQQTKKVACGWWTHQHQKILKSHVETQLEITHVTTCVATHPMTPPPPLPPLSVLWWHSRHR